MAVLFKSDLSRSRAPRSNRRGPKMRVPQESRLNRSRKIAVPKFNDELKDCPMGGGVWSVVTIRSEWRGEDIAHAGLSKGVAFNDRKLIIFRCTSSYSPSRSKLKLVRMVIGLIA